MEIKNRMVKNTILFLKNKTSIHAFTKANEAPTLVEAPPLSKNLQLSGGEIMTTEAQKRAVKRYLQTEAGKEAIKRYKQSEAGKQAIREAKKRYRERLKAKRAKQANELVEGFINKFETREELNQYTKNYIDNIVKECKEKEL